mmetsp:Transcript_44038/g.104189  ORF Transcript_44038/g.104189 Transcript_44038/m.104189 type:complete len:113 (-) Transcript_44038:978-1316(-)
MPLWNIGSALATLSEASSSSRFQLPVELMGIHSTPERQWASRLLNLDVGRADDAWPGEHWTECCFESAAQGLVLSDHMTWFSSEWLSICLDVSTRAAALAIGSALLLPQRFG